MIMCEKYDQVLVDSEKENWSNEIHIYLFTYSPINVWGSQHKNTEFSPLTCHDWSTGRSHSIKFLDRQELVLRGEVGSLVCVLSSGSWKLFLKIKIPKWDPRACFYGGGKGKERREVSGESSLLIAYVPSTVISIWTCLPRLTSCQWNEIMASLQFCAASSDCLEIFIYFKELCFRRLTN